MSSRNPEIALSTSDNPYNPLVDYDKWENYDRQHDYGTSEYLARVTRTTHEYGDDTYNEDIERAIDEIVLLNLISWRYPNVSYIKIVGDFDSKEANETEEQPTKQF